MSEKPTPASEPPKLSKRWRIAIFIASAVALVIAGVIFSILWGDEAPF